MKLDELKKLVADAFESATDKTIIEKAAVINSKIDEAVAEQQELLDKQADLLKSYKDVVLHTNTKPNPTDNSNPATQGQPLSMEDFADNWFATHDENGVSK